MSNFTFPDYADRIIRHNKETWPRAAMPTAWADRRLDMREATPWFNTQDGGYQATRMPYSGSVSLYTSDDYFTTGLFIGGFADLNSYMDAEVLITSLNHAQSADGTTRQRYNSASNALRLRKLVGVIIGKGNIRNSRGGPVACRIFPCDGMPTNHDCWILDWFLPVYMWPMKSSVTGNVIWMVKYQKWKLDERSWWGNAAHGMPPSNDKRDYSIKAKQGKCQSCSKSSKRIYADTFVCLNQHCPAVWCVNGQVISDDQHYKYADEFLKERYDPRLGCDFPADYPLLYPDFTNWHQQEYLFPFDEAVTAENFKPKMNILMTGFCCPQCKMLNCRVRWNEWHCRNRMCASYSTAGPGDIFRKPGYPPNMSLTTLADCITNVVQDYSKMRHYVNTTHTAIFTIHNFRLADGCFVAVMKPKDGTMSLQESNRFYQAVQDLASSGQLGLERRTIDTRVGISGTAHFAANFGAPYHLVVNIGTEPWQTAPRELEAARARAAEWCKNYGPSSRPDFNELYLAGYLSSQKMGWHSDGEAGLGEVIATWTLGGSGHFKFRILEKYKTGMYPLSSRLIEDDPVVEGCDHYKERLKIRQMLDAGKISHEQWAEKFKKIVSKKVRVRRGENILLGFDVAHGDVVVMHGPNTQQYLQHCVDVDSPLRFALTFRHITDPFLGDPKNRDHREARLTQRLAYDMEYDPKDDDDIASNTDHSEQIRSDSLRSGAIKRIRNRDDDDDDEGAEKPLAKKLRRYPDTSNDAEDDDDHDDDRMRVDG